jgi:hypothetical protein
MVLNIDGSVPGVESLDFAPNGETFLTESKQPVPPEINNQTKQENDNIKEAIPKD